MARARAGSLSRKTGINVLPIVVFTVIALLAGGGLFTWDYLWRKQQEEANRPPAPEVIAKNLVENIIGQGSVKAATVDEGAGRAAVTFESATYKPNDPKVTVAKAKEFLTAEATLAGQSILAQMPQIKTVELTIVAADGKTLVRATAARGQRTPQMTFVDPRLK